jgi:hypothetical protein
MIASRQRQQLVVVVALSQVLEFHLFTSLFSPADFEHRLSFRHHHDETRLPAALRAPDTNVGYSEESRLAQLFSER